MSLLTGLGSRHVQGGEPGGIRTRDALIKSQVLFL